MKKTLFALLPLLFLAAGEKHQAFGPIHFGMKNEAFISASNQLMREMHSSTIATFNAVTARKYFAVNGKRFTARLETRDASVRLFMEMTPPHPATGQPLEAVTVSCAKLPGTVYDSQLKDTWEVLRDIADCKLPRVGQRGQFPKPSEVLPGNDVVTDTWEGEGIQIELMLRNVIDPVSSDPAYLAALRVTEISPASPR